MMQGAVHYWRIGLEKRAIYLTVLQATPISAFPLLELSKV